MRIFQEREFFRQRVVIEQDDPLSQRGRQVPVHGKLGADAVAVDADVRGNEKRRVAFEYRIEVTQVAADRLKRSLSRLLCSIVLSILK